MFEHCMLWQDLLACFSSDENGTRNEGYEVKVAAPRLGAASEVDAWRVRAMAQQVRDHDLIERDLMQETQFVFDSG